MTSEAPDSTTCWITQINLDGSYQGYWVTQQIGIGCSTQYPLHSSL